MSNVPLIKVEGEGWLNPAPLFTYEGEQLVSSARNSNGVTTGTLINRRLTKLDGLEWRGLTREQWHNIRVKIEQMYVNITMYDDLSDSVITRKFYFGNNSQKVLDWDRSGEVLIPKTYVSCKVNLIDCGEPD